MTSVWKIVRKFFKILNFKRLLFFFLILYKMKWRVCCGLQSESSYENICIRNHIETIESKYNLLIINKS